MHARMTPDELAVLCDRLAPPAEAGPICPFCGRDPYHYVDVGVGYQRAAVECCELGIGLFQHGDEQLVSVAALMLTAGRELTAIRAERDAERDAALAREAAAFEVAALRASKYMTDGRFYLAESHAFALRQSITTLTPADSQAALDRMLREAYEQGKGLGDEP